MTEKEIKKLSRQDLLIILAEQTEKIDQLEKNLQAAEGKLKERLLAFDACGTMAEAALRINEVFKSADDAATQYLENIRMRQEEQIAVCERMEAEGTQKRDALILDAEKTAADLKEKSEMILREAEGKAAEIIRQAEETAAQKMREAEARCAQENAKIDAHWDEIYARICSMEKEYSWLRGIIKENIGDKR